MPHRILSTRVSTEPSLVLVRDRARQIGELFGLDELQRTRLAMAVSEVARNAALHAKGGRIEFLLDDNGVPGEPGRQCIAVRVEDQGPGIAQLESVLDGSFRPRAQKAFGLAGSRRLADGFEIASTPAGTTVTLWMQIPHSLPHVSAAQLDTLVEQLSRRKALTPAEELEQRHRELLLALEALRQCQDELHDTADARREAAGHAMRAGIAPEPPPAAEAPPAPDAAPPAIEAPQAARRILLIDDNVDNVDMLAEVLRLHGQQVMVATDGIRGLEIARSFLPHVIVVDIGLPVMDGFEVGRALRADTALGHPYLATLSGYGTEAVRQRSLEAGYDTHFTKPVDINELLARLRSLDLAG